MHITGPASESIQYFSKQHSPYRSPKLIFDVLEKRQDNKDERKTSPEEWNNLYQNSPYYNQYVEKRIKSLDNSEFSEGLQPLSVSEKISYTSYNNLKSLLKQTLNLTFRKLLVFWRDKSDVGITFGQAPLMAIAFFFVFQSLSDKGLSFFQHLREYSKPDVIIFLAVLSAVWFGSSKAISEIPSSKIFYHQERLSFLNNFAFIISRFLSLSVITLVQVILFASVFHLVFVVIPVSKFCFLLFAKSVILLWLISVASVSFHMGISFFIRSASAANAILPFMIILQILLGGSLIQPLIKMKPYVYVASWFMTSRWGFEASALLFEKNLDRPSGTTEIIKQTDLKADIYVLTDEIDKKSEPSKKLGYEERQEIEKAVKGMESGDISDKDSIKRWKWMIHIYPKFELFRQPHAKTTWIMLFGITLVWLTILSVCFRIKYKKGVRKI